MNWVKREVLNEILEADLLDKKIGELSGDEVSKIQRTLNEELLMNSVAEQFANSFDLRLSQFIEINLSSNSQGKDILDVYEALGKIAKEELHPSINFHWYAGWDEFLDIGNFFTRPEPFDLVEVVIRIEEEFGLQISDEDAESLKIICDTVRYLWKKTRLII